MLRLVVLGLLVLLLVVLLLPWRKEKEEVGCY